MDQILQSDGNDSGIASYLSLYRKWRPRSFKTLIGQEVPVTILVNSLKENRVNHAYLFCGSRGIGKTTTARILAMSLNCLNRDGVEPCGICEICRSIQAGSSLDVVEIDAASHRGIDEIRDLREKVKYVPLHCRHKVYIIDEVHMLTTEAFNALLKTLEEPPRYVVFILATTEPQRIPDTIISRCSRINFNRIDQDNTVAQLKMIAQAEGLTIDEEVLYLIARKADGALRDAESYLEQVAAWGGPVDFSTAARILREVDPENLDELFTVFLAAQAGEAILLMNQWLKDGLSPEDLTKSLLNYFRTLLVSVLVKNRSLAGTSQERWEKIQSLIKGLEAARLREALGVVQKVLGEMRRSPQPQVLLELAAFDIMEKLGNHVLSPSSSQVGSRSVRVPEPQSRAQEKQVVPPQPEPVPVSSPAGTDDSAGRSMTAEPVQVEWWSTVLQEIKKKRIALYAFLQEARLRENDSASITLAFGSDCQFHKESVERADNVRYLAELVEKEKGTRCRIECLIDPELPVQSESPAAPDSGFPENPQRLPVNPASEHPPVSEEASRSLVQEAADLFSGIVVQFITGNDHTKGGWGDAEYEKFDERSPENAG